MMVVSHCPAEQRWTLPPVGPHRRLGGVLLHPDGFLGFLLVVALISA
jgi:hypothetical protein